MRVEVESLGSFYVIRLVDTVMLASNISEVERLVRTLLDQCKLRIAIAYPEGSFFNSSCLAVVLRVSEYVSEAGGTFVVVNPTSEIVGLSSMLAVGDRLKTCDSIDNLSAL